MTGPREFVITDFDFIRKNENIFLRHVHFSKPGKIPSCHKLSCFFEHKNPGIKTLKKRCPTFLSFAISGGDWRFKCVDKQLFRNEFLTVSTLYFSKFFVNSGGSKAILLLKQYGWTLLL